MQQAPEIDAAVIDRLIADVARRTGFAKEAILPAAIRRVVTAELERGHKLAEVLPRAVRGEPALVRALSQAVSVGETYFFRQPAHFQFLATEILPTWTAEAGRPFTAWSAGCASGEEAYSLAACVTACLGPAQPVLVLGTDLSERSVAVARKGAFTRWSVRRSASLLYNIFEADTAKGFRIRENLLRITRFAVHNLLSPPLPEWGQFDLILCRNVLVYFTREAARTVCGHLTAALRPGGTLFVGATDINEDPPGLARIGPSEIQAYTLPRSAKGAAETTGMGVSGAAYLAATVSERSSATEGASRASSSSGTHMPTGAQDRRPVAVTDERLPDIEPVALHLRALAEIERGALPAAEKLLVRLHEALPTYVAGVLELALLVSRSGRRALAADLMRQVIAAAAGLPTDEILPGPEPMPTQFYLAMAERFLELEGGGERHTRGA
jgi:chemotaxis protein methyltransferase CheR